MHRLQQANLQKCVALIEEFQQAVPGDSLDNILEEKKSRAEQAVEQIKLLFSNGGPDPAGPDPDQCSACRGGDLSQTINI